MFKTKIKKIKKPLLYLLGSFLLIFLVGKFLNTANGANEPCQVSSGDSCQIPIIERDPSGSTSTVHKYKCSGSSCVQDDANGTYTSSDCNGMCSTTPPPSTAKYKCQDNSCVQDDINGTYSSSDCDGMCGTSPPPSTEKYLCSGSSCIRDDANGTYTSSDCDSMCNGIPPISSGCDFVYGNQNAKIVFILARANNPGTSLCSGSWQNTNTEYENFKQQVSSAASGAGIFGGSSNQFGVWVAKNVVQGGGGSVCSDIESKASYYSHGWVVNGNGNGAESYIGGRDAYYCKNTLTKNIFAHEQVGHNFGGLMDEYIGYPMSFVNMFKYKYNCSSDASCSKWAGIDSGCVSGCAATDATLYRSSSSSFMRTSLSSYVSPIQQYVIDTMANNPSGGRAQLNFLNGL